jgi:MFS family permease
MSADPNPHGASGGRSLRRNTALCVAGEGLWGLHAALVTPMTVLTLLLRHYGAGARMIGAITAIESGLIVLPQVFGLYGFRSLASRKRRLIAWHYALPIPLLLLSGAAVLTLDAHLSPIAMRWLLSLLFALFTTSIGIIGGVWMDWLAHLFPRQTRGTVFGLTFFSSALCGTLGAAAAGRILRVAPGLPTYGVLYIAGAAIAALSITAFVFIRDPAAGQPETRARLSLPDTLRRFRLSVADELRAISGRPGESPSP